MRFEVFSVFFFLFILFGGSTSTAVGNKTIRYKLINELPVAASADEVWAAFSDRNLPKLLLELLPGFFESIDILEGDGGLGTVLRIVYPPGSVPLTNKEKFVTVDDRRRLKEVLLTEGGYLDLGVTFFMESFQVLPKGHNSCIVRSIVKYIVKDESAAEVAQLISVEGLLTMARAVTNYVLDQKKLANNTKN